MEYTASDDIGNEGEDVEASIGEMYTIGNIKITASMDWSYLEGKLIANGNILEGLLLQE